MRCIGKPEGKIHVEDQCDGRTMCNVGTKEIGWDIDWINFTQRSLCFLYKQCFVWLGIHLFVFSYIHNSLININGCLSLLNYSMQPAPHLHLTWRLSPPLHLLPSPHKMYPSCQTMLYLHITRTVLWFVFCCCPQVGLFTGYTAICCVLLWLAGSCNIRTSLWWWRCLGVKTSWSYNERIIVNNYFVYIWLNIIEVYKIAVVLRCGSGWFMDIYIYIYIYIYI
jgi:hypothetical protein